MGSIRESVRYILTGDRAIPKLPFPEEGELFPSQLSENILRLPEAYQAELVRQELIRVMNGEPEAYGIPRLMMFPILPEQIEQAPLSDPLTNYLLQPFAQEHKDYLSRWQNPRYMLKLTVTKGTYMMSDAHLVLKLQDENLDLDSEDQPRGPSVGIALSVGFGGYPKREPTGWLDLYLEDPVDPYRRRAWEPFTPNKLQETYYILKGYMDDVHKLISSQELLLLAGELAPHTGSFEEQPVN